MEVNLKKTAKLAKHYEHVLLLMRHAKSEPAHDGGDERRELTGTGRKQAKLVGRGLAGMNLVPDRIACSSATRAEQTLERMLKVFGDKPEIDYRQSLYDGQGLAAVFDELSATKHKVHTLMVLGHEPTISMACQWIADADDPQYGVLNLGLSPASVVVLGANDPFDAWKEHSTTILAVINPGHFS